MEEIWACTQSVASWEVALSATALCLPAELHDPCPTLQQLTETAPPLLAYMGSREFLVDPPASDENGKTSDPLRIAMPG
jgi:hypothetical protein